MNRRILIDTHIWIWHINGDDTISPRIRKIIDNCAQDDELYISAISVWEIAMLAMKNKIVLNTSCQTWVNKSLSLPGDLINPAFS